MKARPTWLTWMAAVGLGALAPRCGGRTTADAPAPPDGAPADGGVDDLDGAGPEALESAVDAPDGSAGEPDAPHADDAAAELPPCVTDDDCVGHQKCYGGICCNGDFDPSSATCACGDEPACLPYQLCCDTNNKPTVTVKKCTYHLTDCSEW